MRRFVSVLSVLVVALALAGGAAALRPATPAHAVGSACYFSDWPNTLYWDGQVRADHPIYDIGSGGFQFTVHMAIDAYRYSDSSNGHCYRYYKWTTWNDGNEVGNMVVGGRVWVCGTYWGTSWSGSTGSSYTWQTTLIDYGAAPCGRQVDNFRSYETPTGVEDWTPVWPDTYTNASPNWYCTISDGGTVGCT